MVKINRKVAALVGGLAVAGAGLGIGLALAPPTCPSFSTIQQGGTFDVSGCIYTGNFEFLSSTVPVVINGGSWNNPTTVAPFKPTITARQSSNITIENAAISGANVNGLPIGQTGGAGGAGIDILDSTNITLTNDTINNVYGDCLELWAVPPKYTTPDQVQADNLSLNNCGRNGITPADVTNTFINNTTIGHVAQVGVGFESDLASALGSFTMSNSSMSGVEVSERPLGPVTFNNDKIAGGQIQFLGGANNVTLWKIPPVFNQGSFVGTTKAVPAIICRNYAAGTFNGMTLTVGGKGDLFSVQPSCSVSVNP